ncbi:MAG: TAT-variant-translocated molybdopterin oxidoreductase, partial [Armatimonadetes bacterium]|nr:TAT-variant-translocated molybdopterin oxidoreductase [Armatimonadota bacterium]
MSSLIQITDKTGRKLEETPLDLEAARAKLAATNGKGYWRSLEELSEQPGFGEMLRREFPGQAPKDWAPLPRRDFLRLMGASLALAGLSGCAFQPPEKIVPYVTAPENLVPGIPLFYATARPFMGYALGVTAESHEGRPTKIEGNPNHPSNPWGRTDVWAQASILDLYDPDRSQFVRQSGASSDWQTFVGAATSAVAQARATQGAGLSILTETITSPTQLAQLAEIQRQLPRAKWHSYEPVNRDNVRAGVRLAMGRDLHPIYHFDRADVIVSLDCDFLLEEPNRVEYAAQFISGRKLTEGQKRMNRLYVIESTPTNTGAMADHRLGMKAAQIESFARALAGAVGVAGVAAGGELPANSEKWIAAIAADLRAHRGRALVCAGFNQTPAVNALAHAITATLGGAGATGTISYHEPVEGNPRQHSAALRELVSDMNAGRVQTLLIMGANPAYSAPADLDFAEALKRVPTRMHFGHNEDETSVLCNWHVPEAHYLETWSDARAIDGTVSIVQPLVRPLYEAARSPVEMLSVFAGNPNLSAYDAVRGYWLTRRGGVENMAFDRFWQRTLHEGFIPGTAAPAVGATLAPGFAAALPAPTRGGGGLEVSIRPDPTIWDGRFANNAWLQECPKPVSKITWDNAFFVSPDTALKNGWNTDREAILTLGGRSVKGAVFLLPGQPDDSITIHMGYGRNQVGKIGTGAGFNANVIRTSDAPYFASGATLELTGNVYKIATTTKHNLIAPNGAKTAIGDALLLSNESKTKVINNILTPETADLDIDGTHGRDIVRVGTFADYLQDKLPTGPLDKKGVPLAYPENPPQFREAFGNVMAEGHENTTGPLMGNTVPQNHGDGKRHNGAKPHGGAAPHGEAEHGGGHKRLIPQNREAEGFDSFYPRNADPLALQLYKSDEVNREEAIEAKLKGRANLTQQWGMTVDLQSCIGCNACVISCQSENNSAVVGKDQVLMNREMHWIRIDTYYRGSYENPEVYFEPMMCQHCEKAPCEPVCPFNATMHSPDGISEQIYNRCVGTKYCENNCPYKVRRFNFLQYADQQTPVIQLMQNPDVTVRSRGVMEKCTYCIQRVRYATQQADKEDRLVADGEIQVACAQSCPTNAIVFGDINDPESQVSLLKRGPLTFGILTELNTLPRTSYLARFKNPNPALAAIDKPAFLGGEHNSAGHGEEAEGQEVG